MRLPIISTFLLLSIFACDKDDDNANNCAALEGEWTGFSWIEDDEQFFGDTIFVSQSDLHFMPLTDGQGDMEWHLDYTFGGGETIMGVYSVNDACNEITITPKSGGTSSTYDFDINGNQLVLSGVINNVDMELKFNRN
jgi:hypothetical protein